MKKFKITFPTGHSCTNVINDNIDINIVFSNGEVYFGTLITPINILYLMDKNNMMFLSMPEMFIIKNLEKETINNAISNAIKDTSFSPPFVKIGNIHDIYGNLSYDELIDLNDSSGDNCISVR